MSKTAFFRIAAGMSLPAAAVLGLALTLLAGCGKAPGGAAVERSSIALPTKEEVGAILGNPVTSVEGAATDMAYKTAVVGIEVTVGIERDNDAQLATSGARKATGMLGGTPQDVPNLGEEAFFGAMSVLYVPRGHGDHDHAAQSAVGGRLRGLRQMAEARLGCPEQLQAFEGSAGRGEDRSRHGGPEATG